MKRKVILISVDGMRPDGFEQCGNPYVEELKSIASYAPDARTVFPSVTLPCHMSMFHSVPPERHGITSNTYMAQVRPVSGLFEQIKASGGKSVMYYGWEEIRDVARPGSLIGAEYINAYAFDHTDAMLTERALTYLKANKPDFCFLYLVETDDKGGHDAGWMTETYLDYVSRAVSHIRRVIEEMGEEYTVIITADHGGHGRAHGTEMEEDMTIPMLFVGPEFKAGEILHGVSILDIAPTIGAIMDVRPAVEWEGKALIG